MAQLTNHSKSIDQQHNWDIKSNLTQVNYTRKIDNRLRIVYALTVVDNNKYNIVNIMNKI